MKIIGPDALVFGVDDVAACAQYLQDYGLRAAGDGRYEALDGTAIVIKPKDDAALPPGLGTESMLRETVYGVADAATLDAIEREMQRDREVTPPGRRRALRRRQRVCAGLPGDRAQAAELAR
jgi:hypothetical protein